ncbi:MAG: helix-turn-helix domain-containing protein [Candidatus Marinimicrobia bacterium]|nr:helix-turn-helix domain-containing protein [Candidatus Neomarinimicrobiota bacterium]MBT5069869.1 helix-turn-helix domain-containing protein [Candidatus Neomarinimicrobiota bacterium]MBT5759408.1 helix-turn-helix domain-containing protein [Candidatus Neomarinimicrobiota bacterium]MBT6472180.1 helix-turn-helix domain-containing protein [Candidatus Neomarinimicrobiota bacterium]MBT6938016.1 helix-turn-helix domain-containing protein [Candidatus Neomarinimicrobiota bacterium]
MDKELTLGQKIKRYRLMNDIRQEDMAESLGVSRATLINYEKGHTTINVDVLDRLNETFSDFDLQNKEDNKPKIIQDNIIDFGVLFSVINKSKKYILSITIILAIIGTGFSFLFSKYYLAQVSLYPAKKDYTQGLGQFQSLASNFGMSVPSSDQDFNIPDVVKSNLIANKVLKEKWLSRSGAKISLIELWELDQSPWYLFSSPNMVDYAFVNEKAIANLLNHVTVTEDRQTGLIKINVTLEDPIIAAQVANYIGEQVQIYIQKGNAAQAAKEKLFISDRLVIVKNELESIELDLKDFKERNRGYDDSPELFMVFSRLFREVEAKKQVYLTLQQQLELSRIEEVKQTPILHILDHAVPPARKSSPNRALFLALSAIFGLFSSSLVTIFKY